MGATERGGSFNIVGSGNITVTVDYEIEYNFQSTEIGEEIREG